MILELTKAYMNKMYAMARCSQGREARWETKRITSKEEANKGEYIHMFLLT